MNWWLLALGVWLLGSIQMFRVGYRLGYRADIRNFPLLSHEIHHLEGLWWAVPFAVFWPFFPVILVVGLVVIGVGKVLVPKMEDS